MNTNNAILITILLVFLIVGYITPYAHTAFSEDSTSVDINSLEDSVGQETIAYNPVTMFDVFKSMFSMFFWTFGALPVWLDMVFILFRIIFYVIIYDKVRGI